MPAAKGTRPPNAGNRKGRPKGAVNKLTRSIKEAFSLAFDTLGGAPALAKWGKSNPTEFYKLAARLIPVEVQAKVEHRDAVQMTDDELAAIARGSCSGNAGAAPGSRITH